MEELKVRIRLIKGRVGHFLTLKRKTNQEYFSTLRKPLGDSEVIYTQKLLVTLWRILRNTRELLWKIGLTIFFTKYLVVSDTPDATSLSCIYETKKSLKTKR